MWRISDFYSIKQSQEEDKYLKLFLNFCDGKFVWR